MSVTDSSGRVAWYVFKGENLTAGVQYAEILRISLVSQVDRHSRK